MDKLGLVIAIIEKLLRYGPEAVIDIAAAFQVGEPTPEGIRKLKITKNPEDFFK